MLIRELQVRLSRVIVSAWLYWPEEMGMSVMSLAGNGLRSRLDG